MIPHNHTHPVESSVNNPIKNFSIAVNANTFDILMGKLYETPIQTLVQEVVSNAWDAHQAAGTTRKIDVTEPTYTNSHFIVKDYGTGLSETAIAEIYTSLCTSTKQSDNNSFGGYGLGCKSPFSYTDNFSVESRYEGMRATYALFKNADGTPSYVKLDEAPTDEPNGLTVTIPVKSQDGYKFTNALDRLCYFADDITYEVAPPQPIWKGSIGGFYKLPIDRALYICVHKVLYKIELPYNVYSTFHRTYNWGASIVLHAAIGEFRITPSKEAIILDDASIGIIVQKLEILQQEFDHSIHAVINRCPNYYAACIELHDVYKTAKAVEWWGKRFYGKQEIKETLEMPIDGSVKCYPLVYSRRSSSFIKDPAYAIIKITPGTKTIIYWADKKLPRIVDRIRKIPNASQQYIYLAQGDSIDALKAQLEEVKDAVTYKALADIDPPTRERARRNNDFRLLYNRYSGMDNEPTAYVITHHDQPEYRTTPSGYYLQTLVEWINTHTELNINNIAFVPRAKKTTAQKQGLFSFFDVLKATLENYARTTSYIHWMEYEPLLPLIYTLEPYLRIHNNSDLRDLVEFAKEYNKERFHDVNGLPAFLQLELPTPNKPTQRLLKTTKRYAPLAQFMDLDISVTDPLFHHLVTYYKDL